MSVYSALYERMEAMDNQDTPLEEWPAKLIESLTAAGFAVVPRALPFGVLGDAAIAGVFNTGNPKHGWDYLLARVSTNATDVSSKLTLERKP